MKKGNIQVSPLTVSQFFYGQDINTSRTPAFGDFFTRKDEEIFKNKIGKQFAHIKKDQK